MLFTTSVTVDKANQLRVIHDFATVTAAYVSLEETRRRGSDILISRLKVGRLQNVTGDLGHRKEYISF